MKTRTLTWAGLAAVLAILALVLIPAVAMAKKPPPPPPPPPPSDPDPVIAYRLVADGAAKLMVMNADGSNQTTVLEFDSAAFSRPDWSPDGTQLVFGADIDGELGIYIMNVDGTGSPTQIASTERLAAPVWSPMPVPGAGGAYLIAYQDAAWPGATWEIGLFLVTPDGSDPVQLEDHPVDGANPTWSPDGTRIAFTELNTRGKYCILEFTEGGCTYTSYLFTGAMTDIRPFDLSWAKTQDDKIVFQIISGSYDRDIYVLDLDDPTTATQLTSLRGLERLPSWSSDDEKIVFELESNPRKTGSRPVIAVMNPDGSGITTIQSGGSRPTWKR